MGFELVEGQDIYLQRPMRRINDNRKSSTLKPYKSPGPDEIAPLPTIAVSKQQKSSFAHSVGGYGEERMNDKFLQTLSDIMQGGLVWTNK